MEPDSRAQLRQAGPADARAIAVVHVTTWQAAYRRIVPAEMLDSLSVELRTSRWNEQLAGGTTTTWVAEVDGRIVGFADVAGSRDDDATGSTGELNALYVSASHWSQGIGRALCERSFAILEEKGFREITTWVLADNVPARRFYEMIGMQVDGTEKSDTFFSRDLREVRYRIAFVDTRSMIPS